MSVLLRRRRYWGEITGKGWRDMIRVSIVAYNCELSGIKKVNVAKTVARVIAQGCFNSELCLWIPKEYDFMMGAMQHLNCDSAQCVEAHLRMAMSFASKIAKEYRELACQFGEEVLEKVLKCYDPLVEETELLKCLVLEFLIFQLKIHHPNGAALGTMGAYAHEHEKWETGLNQMFFLMRAELSQVKKRDPVTSSCEPLLGRFLVFAVEVSYQVMTITQRSSSATTGISDVPLTSAAPKEMGFEILISSLDALPEESAWSWLYIMSSLLKKFVSMDESTYVSLLDHMADFVSSPKDGFTLHCLFRCSTSFAEVPVPSTVSMLDYTPGWQKIWHKAVWAIGLDQCEESAHETIRAILTNNLFTSMQEVTELFNLYLTDRISPSDGSIQSMLYLLTSFNIVDGMEQVTRETCLNWVYPVKEKTKSFQDPQSMVHTAEVLVQLCLKGCMKKVGPKKSGIKVEPLEHFYSKMLFCDGLLIPHENPSEAAALTSPDEMSLNDASIHLLKSMVTHDAENLVCLANTLLASNEVLEGGVAASNFMSSQLQVITLVTSGFIEAGVCSANSEHIMSLIHSFKIILESLADLLEVLMRSPQALKELGGTLSTLATLYELQIDEHIDGYMRENTPRKLIDLMKATIMSKIGALKNMSPQYIRGIPEKYVSGSIFSHEYLSLIDSQIYHEKAYPVMETSRILGAYCCIRGTQSYLTSQRDTMLFFLGILPKEPNEKEFPLKLQMLLSFLYVQMNRMEMKECYLNIALSKFQQMLGMYSNDVELLHILLSVHEELALKAVDIPSIQNIAISATECYAKNIYNAISERRLPPLLNQKIVRLMGALIKINPALTWPWMLSADEKPVTLSSLLLQELDSPYAEVRMKVAESIHLLLCPRGLASTTEGSSNVLPVAKSIISSCSDEKNISVEDHRKGKYLQISLHCLCVVAVTTPALRKSSIYSLLRLIANCHVDRALGKSIFRILAEELNSDCKMLLCGSLADFLEKWVVLSDFKEFPYWLCYDSMENFYTDNIGVILSILWRANHKAMEEFCQATAMTIPQMLKDHAGVVVALTLSRHFNSEDELVSGGQAAQSAIEEMMHMFAYVNTYEIFASEKNALLYYIFKMYHNEEKVEVVAGCSVMQNCAHKMCYPEKGLHYYTEDMVVKSFQYLSLWNNDMLGIYYLDYLIAESPNHFHNVIFLLANDIINASSACDAIAALVAFQYYVEYIMDYLAHPRLKSQFIYLRRVWTGIIRDTCFSICRVIRKWSHSKNNEVSALSLVYLDKDLKEYFIPLLPGLDMVLVPLIYTLVDIVNEGYMEKFEEHVLNIIMTLLETRSLKEDLANLMAFPNTLKFSNLNETLAKLSQGGGKSSLKIDLCNTLTAYSMLGYARIEMLQFLQTMLREKKGELKHLYGEIDERNNYTNYRETVLHRIICLLCKLSISSEHEVRTEAAKCLAELGPGDMGTMILIPQTTLYNTKGMPGYKLKKLTEKSLELLPKYLLDESMEVVDAASTALTAIVTSKEGEVTLRVDWPFQLRLAEDYLIMLKRGDEVISLSPLDLDEAAFRETHDLWVPSEGCSHSKWITALLIQILRCFTSMSAYLEKLIKICSLKVPFCEEIFPFVVEIFLNCGGISQQQLLFERIRHFFSVCYHSFRSRIAAFPLQVAGAQVMKDKACIVTMVNLINYLNLQHYGMQMRNRLDKYKKKKHNDGSAVDEEDAIDYLHCAVAAVQCSAYLSCIQYCSLWISHVSVENGTNTLAYHVDAGTPHVQEIVHVLQVSYAGLGQIDGLYSCGSSHLLTPEGRIDHYKHLDKWQDVMRSYELEVSFTGNSDAIDGLLLSMQMQGMEEMLMGLLESRDQEEMLGCKYECAWRLGSWDLLSQFTQKKKHSSALLIMDDIPNVGRICQVNEKELNAEFHRSIFLAIRSIRSYKYTECLNQLVEAREFVMNSIPLSSLEACENIYRPMSRLHALKEIEEFATVFKVSRDRALATVLSLWEQSDLIVNEAFKTIEPVKALRLTLLKYCLLEPRRRAVSEIATESPIRAMAEIQLKLGQRAREAGMYAMSEKYLRAVRAVPGLSENMALQCRLKVEEAQLYWAKGDVDVAKIVLRSMMTDMERLVMDEALARCHADALTLYGHWVMKTHSERVKVALTNYFVHALDLLNKHEVPMNSHEYLNAIRAIASYADEQYIQSEKYVQSEAFQSKKQCVSHSMYIVSDFEGARQIAPDERRSLMIFGKQAILDEKELEECEADKTSFLEIALRHYIKILKFSPEVELEIAFRFVSLFLGYKCDEEDLFSEIATIPSYKFVALIPQLLPRIVCSKGRCSSTLKKIVVKCAIEHPHHVLPHILALAFSLQDLDKVKGSDAFITETQKSNQSAAQTILEKLRKQEKLTEHIEELSALWEALISLAYMKVDKKFRVGYMGPTVQLSNFRNLTHVQVPTLELPISPTGEYGEITSVWKYQPEYGLVGGINVPKKIVCVGSDGMRYPQLLKGRDDLRQDAVMQQVFHLMNILLKKDDEARKRKLRIRTYRVVPLSHRSGLIEWCTATMSIGSYLYGGQSSGGAHSRFNPSDYTIHSCRNMLAKVQESTKQVKLQVFLEICENLHPVFRYYFLTEFPNPGVWYEMQQSYIRSVATSSIIGYVLGLGDRHPQNILIDKSTAEFLHVDLGESFEQGRTKNPPETVPFRLTRDIVDGMGISGVEGDFRRSCEVTMALMRKYHQAILSVVEVLIYDPLYAWTLKPKYKLQEAAMEAGLLSSGTSTTTASDEGNAHAQPVPSPPPPAEEPPAKCSPSKDSTSSASGHTSFATTEANTESAEKSLIAVRALERLEQKLLGTEDGTPASSVEAQVQRLIQEAQDPENLCALYAGWQPYL